MLKSENQILKCPVCGDILKINEIVATCIKGHSFDISKEGYLNLLQCNKKNSLAPGDNFDMVTARIEFLAKNYYKPLADKLSEIIFKLKATYILDSGCGFGYYTNNIKKSCENIFILGVDISKAAIKKAAALNKDSQFIIASIYDLPIKDGSMDAILCVFSPRFEKEFSRVLNDDGFIIEVCPGENHLKELKQLLYDEQKDYAKYKSHNNYQLHENINLEYQMNIQSNKDLLNLFQMTPFYYRTSKKSSEKLSDVNTLTITANFNILVWKKVVTSFTQSNHTTEI